MTRGFALHPSIDPAALAAEFAAARRVRIAPFLAEGEADSLRAHLADRADWTLALRVASREFAFDSSGLAAFGADQVAGLRMLAAPVGDDFTYAYRRIVERSGPDRETEDDTILSRFADFMSSEAVIALFRTVTGSPAIAFADAKASRYDPGDFLSLHHDRVEGSDRIAAYVLSLNENWRAEHGGMLLFHEGAGDALHGWVPEMNALTLFAVPQGHSVSQVTPFAPEPRYSVTGWLRSVSPA